MGDSRALLALLSAWPGPAPAPSPEAQPPLIAAAARHGLAAFVEHAARSAGWDWAPAERAALRRESLACAARGLRVKTLLLRSLDALAAEGVVPVLLKGYGLSLRLYPDPLQRATSDVDLLVARSEVEASSRALKGLGLSLVPEGEGGHADTHHREFKGSAGLVELHYRALAGYGLALEADALLARAREAELEGRRVRYLRPQDELIYLALHASNHLLQRLAWLFDLKLLALAHPDLRWAEAVEVARGTAFPHLAWYALEAARRLVGAPVPDAVLAALAPPRWQRVLAARFFSEERLVAAHLAHSKPAWVGAKLLLAPRLLPMARYSVRWLRAR
ncbi:nucleotidyltransferase family protein [Myxococcaceae bacterium GXIMD 01537]